MKLTKFLSVTRVLCQFLIISKAKSQHGPAFCWDITFNFGFCTENRTECHGKSGVMGYDDSGVCGSPVSINLIIRKTNNRTDTAVSLDSENKSHSSLSVNHISVSNVDHLRQLDRVLVHVATGQIPWRVMLQGCLLFRCHVRNHIAVLNALELELGVIVLENLGVGVMERQTFMHNVSEYRLGICKYFNRT
jgi:hypothetical protein